MPRTLTASVLTEIAETLKRPAWFAELEFTSGFLRLWTGFADITATMPGESSQTWTPVGNLGGIGPVKNTDDLRADGLTLSLSGIDSGQLALALGSVRQGKSCKLWLGFLDASYALIADTVLVFEGLMDVPSIEEGAETSTITIQAENRLARLRKSSGRRYTHEDQQIDYAGDEGFEYVVAVSSGRIFIGGRESRDDLPSYKPDVR